MKFKNRIGLITAIVLVVGGLVFMGVQNAKADDIHGTADNITGTSMTVGNKTLVISSETQIMGQLVPGSIVQIMAKVQDDGTLLATRIVVKNSSDEHDDDDEIEGIIQSIGANNSSIVINGHTILMDDHTRIDDGHLAVNARAEVEVVKLQNGSLLATEIEIEDDNDDEEDDD
jgi:hypothetical protein